GALKTGGDGKSWLAKLLGKKPAGQAPAASEPQVESPADAGASQEELMGAQMMADILGGDDPEDDAPLDPGVETKAVPESVRDGGGADSDDDGASAEEGALLKELGGDIDQVIRAAGQNVNELKKELNSPRAKRLLDGLMGDLVGERAKVQEIAKKLNVT